MKTCFIGDYSVGKTSLIERFVHNRFTPAYVPTIGTQLFKKKLVVGNPRGRGVIQVDMVIWDIMGQKGFRELLYEAYFNGANAILAVCDITRRETLENLYYWINSVYKVTGWIPLRLLANKWDLKFEREMEKDDIAKTADRYGSDYDLTSAKTGRNVEKAFYLLARDHILGSVFGADLELPRPSKASLIP
jgi:small GTP-binding protein